MSAIFVVFQLYCCCFSAIWSPYITNCCKTHILIGLLYRRFYWYTNSPVYWGYTKASDYTSIVWNPNLKGEIESLENVQKFALWVCLKSWDSEWTAQSCQLPPLHKRWAQLSLCHLYKIIHNQCYFPPIFSARETQPFARSNSYIYSIGPYVISLWNSLSESVVCAPSLSV